MLLGSGTAPAEVEAEVSAAGRNVRNQLLARVAESFPGLPVGRSRVESGGGDHVLLIIDDTYAFRFPRAGMHDLKLEIAVLGLLQRRSVVPTPSYDYVDPAGRFAGYRFIEGIELTQSRFAALSPVGKDRVLGQAAMFLSALHSLPRDAVDRAGPWPMAWTAAEYAERGLTERLPSIAACAPHLAGPIEAFYRSYRHERLDRLVVVHGDLVADHILLDEAAERLAGIIDFGDVAIGDPAQDLLAFWSYGKEAASRIVQLYGPSDADSGLLGRSRNHFIRHRIDQLFQQLGQGAGDEARAEMFDLEALLQSPECAPTGPTS